MNECLLLSRSVLGLWYIGLYGPLFALPIYIIMGTGSKDVRKYRSFGVPLVGIGPETADSDILTKETEQFLCSAKSNRSLR